MKSERPLFVEDLLIHFSRAKGKGFKVALIAFTIAFFLLLLFSKPHYKADAILANPSLEEGGSVLLKQVKLDLQKVSPLMVMRSRPILEKVVEELGLQVALPKESLGVRTYLLMKTELGGKGVRERPLFSEVIYDGVEKRTFYLRKISAELCTLYDAHRKEVGQVQIGNEACINGASFLLTRMPKSNGMQKYTLLPKRKAVKQLKRKMRIVHSRQDPSIFKLAYSHPDREIAIGVLDTVMDAYCNYIREDQKESSKQQDLFFKERQRKLIAELAVGLENEKAYMETSLVQHGAIDLKGQMERLGRPHEKWKESGQLLAKKGEHWEEERHLAEAEKKWLEEQDTLFSLDKRGNGSLVFAEADLTAFDGISLEMGERLYSKYCEERDLLYRRERELEEQKGTISFTALSGLFSDGASQERVRLAQELERQSKDLGNRTEKERTRLKSALDSEKESLTSILIDQQKIAQSQITILESKMAGLQQVCLDLIRKEKGFLAKKISEIEKEMEVLPSKWKEEGIVKTERRLANEALDTLTQVYEARKADHHMQSVKSKPLERADAPYYMESSHLFILSSMGGIGAFFFFLVGGFIARANRGLPLSAPYLRLLGFSFFNRKSPSVEEIAALVSDKSIASVVGCSFVSPLADTLKESGRSVLRVTIGKEFPLHRASFHEQIGIGSIYQKGLFEELEKWKKEYDILLIEIQTTSPALLRPLEALVSYTILFLFDEAEEVLAPFNPNNCLCILANEKISL